MKIKFTLVLLVLSTLIAACHPAQPAVSTVTAVPTRAAASETPKPNPTSVPTFTALPPSATPTLVPSLTATPTLTPTQVFAGFRILYSDYQRWGLMLAFYLPGVKEPYNLKVNKVPYTCTLFQNLPDQMFCIGPEFAHNRSVALAFYDPQNENEPIFSTDYLIAPVKTPTPEGYIPLTDPNCPVRGINASCETEDRTNYDPPCVVSTCVDSCGYWYSIDTCENSVPPK